MKNIIKLLLASLAIVFVVIACRDEAEGDWKTPEASFKLYDTSLGSNILYETMKENPLSFVWEKPANTTANYKIEISATSDFSALVTQLGESETTSFDTTVGAFNNKLLTIAYNPYASKLVYIRIVNGNEVSNTISFTVTPYPVDGPIITNPVAGSTVTLNSTDQSAIAATVTWDDYSVYGVNVKYLVEIAAKGSTTYMPLGEVTIPNPNPDNITKSLILTHKSLNDAVLKTGAQPDVKGEFDIRVTATTQSAGGTISIPSALVTINITPFVSNVTLFLVGDATAADWNNDTNNENMYPLLGNHSANTLYTYTGYFKTGGFKIIKDKGSWDNQYGAGSAPGTLSTDGGSGNINITSSGYYKLMVNVSNLTYTLTPLATPGTTYPTIGIIGDATSNNWDSSTPMTQSAFDPHIWYLVNVNLKNGEMKFRANNAWDVNWGSPDEDFGTGTAGGPNIPVKAGSYNIYFNDFTGDYVLIKQ